MAALSLPATLRERLLALAAAALADARRLGRPAAPLTVTFAEAGLVATLTVAPAALARAQLTDCQRAVIDLLADAPMPLIRSQVVADLAATGLPYADVTVGTALAALVRMRLAANSRRPPRGYFLPGGPADPSSR